MEKGYKVSKVLKKSLVCGATLMMLAGVGATAGSNQLASNAHSNVTVTAHASTSNYNHIMNYLHWVQRYNHTHAKNWHSWYLSNLYRYMGGLNHWQAKNVKNTINRYHTWYYANDKSMNTLIRRVNGTRRTAKKPVRRAMIHKVVRHNHNNSRKARRAYYTKRANQANNVAKYLRWVNWYDAHHAKKYTSYKLRHLNNYMGYLSASQKASFNRQANHFNHIHDYPVHVSRRVYRAHKVLRRTSLKRIAQPRLHRVHHYVRHANRPAVQEDNSTASTVKVAKPAKQVTNNNTNNDSDGSNYKFPWDEYNPAQDAKDNNQAMLKQRFEEHDPNVTYDQTGHYVDVKNQNSLMDSITNQWILQNNSH